ncbi:MAG: DUF11 domain-containing protein [Gemmataceae bacterium]|nr:DUF11 domain-containing protein [Gemmataceae bacterium]
MIRRYAVIYSAVFLLAWAGWRSLGAQQIPASPPGSLPVPAVEPAGNDIQPPAVPQPNVPPGMGVRSVPSTGPGKAEPAVRIEWTGPTAVRVGQSNDYTLTVRNTCDSSVSDVKLKVFVASKAVAAAEPRPQVRDGAYEWDLGTIPPKCDRQVQLRLLQSDKGNFGASASVTFTGSAAINIRASEPKIAVKATGPAKCQLGDGTGFVVTVTNPGDGVAERVRITTELADGLEYAKGRQVVLDVGTLQPGESRTSQLLCIARTGGEQVCKVTAEADGGLKATDQVAVNVVAPRLAVETTGPTLRYLDRKATYTIRVTNPGDAPASNVLVQDTLPGGFKFLNADAGGRYDSANRTVSWYVGEIAPGQSRDVSIELQAANTGDYIHEVTAQAARGLKSGHQLPVRIDGISAILLEVVDLEDPIEVGGETTYVIRIANTGSKSDTDIRLICQIPEKMQFKTATGPTGFSQNGNEIQFHPLPNLGPKSDAVYRLTVKATAPGIAHFKARITSAMLVDPVNKEEATRVYADQ